ncbi:hypothetical protein E2C01_023056 [Portunus trituberculatus]|uniref:Uncharacterized protein n=1 Tax=Portunus trituberculatus TaxID=210409 RepID=A0A5B7E8W8_PORTR|nr:hypothetical protein [Portunus trituberculatus]
MEECKESMAVAGVYRGDVRVGTVPEPIGDSELGGESSSRPVVVTSLSALEDGRGDSDTARRLARNTGDAWLGGCGGETSRLFCCPCKSGLGGLRAEMRGAGCGGRLRWFCSDSVLREAKRDSIENESGATVILGGGEDIMKPFLHCHLCVN